MVKAFLKSLMCLLSHFSFQVITVTFDISHYSFQIYEVRRFGDTPDDLLLKDSKYTNANASMQMQMQMQVCKCLP